MTMAGIAARSGVGKPTIYRTWPDSHAVAMAAFIESTEPAVSVRDSHSALQDLRTQLRKLTALLSTHTGKETISMFSAAHGQPDLMSALRNHVLIPNREESRRILERAMQQHEVRADLDLDIVLDLLYGPLYFRVMMGHGPLNTQFADKLLEAIVSGLKG